MASRTRASRTRKETTTRLGKRKAKPFSDEQEGAGDRKDDEEEIDSEDDQEATVLHPHAASNEQEDIQLVSENAEAREIAQVKKECLRGGGGDRKKGKNYWKAHQLSFDLKQAIVRRVKEVVCESEVNYFDPKGREPEEYLGTVKHLKWLHQIIFCEEKIDESLKSALDGKILAYAPFTQYLDSFLHLDDEAILETRTTTGKGTDEVGEHRSTMVLVAQRFRVAFDHRAGKKRVKDRKDKDKQTVADRTAHLLRTNRCDISFYFFYFFIFPFTSNAQTNNCFLIHFSFHQVQGLSVHQRR